MANTSVIRQQAAHTTYQLSSSSPSLNENYLRILCRRKRQKHGPLEEKWQARERTTKWKDGKSNKTRQENKREDGTGESNDSPIFQTGGLGGSGDIREWGGHKTGMVAGNYWLYLSVSLGHLAKGVSSFRAKDRLSGVVITITFVAKNPGLTGCQFTNPRLSNTYNATLVMTWTHTVVRWWWPEHSTETKQQQGERSIIVEVHKKSFGQTVLFTVMIVLIEWRWQCNFQHAFSYCTTFTHPPPTLLSVIHLFLVMELSTRFSRWEIHVLCTLQPFLCRQ